VSVHIDGERKDKRASPAVCYVVYRVSNVLPNPKGEKERTHVAVAFVPTSLEDVVTLTDKDLHIELCVCFLVII
jgi:hypothetical protein